MTGSGGWAYFAVTHYILGIRPEMDSLLIDPCIPGEWKEFAVKRR
jgi:N,N'-diacetylchitobiose phosphorylase